MTHARMPGRCPPLRVVAPAPRWSPSPPPQCSLAESLTDAERAMLAELGVCDMPPQLHLVPRTAAPVPDLRSARRRDLMERLAMWTVLLASVVCAAIGVVTRVAEVAP